MSGDNLSTLDFTCACKNVHGTVQVPSSSLPLRLTLCHCTVCRRQSGLLAASYVSLPKEHKAFKVSGGIKSYKASEDIIRYFCGTCGSNVYVDEKKFNETSLCSGVIVHSSAGEDVARLESQIFVHDTQDGGMSAWFPTVTAWEGFSKESKQVDCSHQQTPRRHMRDNAQVAAAEPELHCYCHCKRIQFKITKPNEESRQVSSPFADLLAPYVSASPGTVANDRDVKWWLCSNEKKYLAGLCACTSCRTNSGFDIQAWTFIPKANLYHMDGKPLDFAAMGDALGEHQSSKGVHRQFCRTCGATVFWRDDVRPGLIDVSVGLLNAEEGSRAESWLYWRTERVSFEEEAPNRVLVESLKSGLHQWGQQRTQ